MDNLFLGSSNREEFNYQTGWLYCAQKTATLFLPKFIIPLPPLLAKDRKQEWLESRKKRRERQEMMLPFVAFSLRGQNQPHVSSHSQQLFNILLVY